MSADWYLMRASGIVSLLLLTVVVALGIASSKRFRPGGLPLYVTTTVHRNASLLAVLFLGVHVLTAAVDPDAAVRLLTVVVPFTTGWSPFWVGLGALAFDLVGALVVTSLLRKHFGYGTWRAIHWGAYAAWPLALLHGLGAGTDKGTGWMVLVDAACVAAVGTAVWWRLEEAGEPPPRGRAHAVDRV